jgi:hypothetical protein
MRTVSFSRLMCCGKSIGQSTPLAKAERLTQKTSALKALIRMQPELFRMGNRLMLNLAPSGGLTIFSLAVGFSLQRRKANPIVILALLLSRGLGN